MFVDGWLGFSQKTSFSHWILPNNYCKLSLETIAVGRGIRGERQPWIMKYFAEKLFSLF